MFFRHIVASLAIALAFLLPASGFAAAGDAHDQRADTEGDEDDAGDDAASIASIRRCSTP